MKTSDFDYHLPKAFIAQTPVEPRDSSRLLVVERRSGDIKAQSVFSKLGEYLKPKDLLVINHTQVISARLRGRKTATGGQVELLLLQRIREAVWECLVGGKGLVAGRQVELDDGTMAEILRDLEGSKRVVKFSKPLKSVLDDIGQVPLPPYIDTPLDKPSRYQTVYSREPGSVAAPTAGLHFTPSLIHLLKNQGINFVTVTLHIGLDTFSPVKVENPRDHKIHTEWCEVPMDTAATINETRSKGGKVIAVGTTSVRALETATQPLDHGKVIVEPFSGFTSLFILPGYEFKAVDAMITNFHLPKSSLLMMVSAFLGRERILAVYEFAKNEGYRFYSFGDAMLIQ